VNGYVNESGGEREIEYGYVNENGGEREIENANDNVNEGDPFFAVNCGAVLINKLALEGEIG